MSQRGGGKCSICGSYGTNTASCPDNPHALATRPDKHPNAKNGTQAPAPKLKPKLKSSPTPAPILKLKPKLKLLPKSKIKPKGLKKPLPQAIPQSQEQDDQIPELEPVIKPLLTRVQCEQWLKDPIINPLTGRLIKIGGPMFNKLKLSCKSYGIQIPEPKGTFEEIYHCNNDSDPVGGEQYGQMQEDEVKNLIRLGSGMCYPLDTLYGWYKTKRQSTEVGKDISVTDPMVPSYVLTDEEIGLINRYMRQQDETYVEPQGRVLVGAPVGYRLFITDYWVNEPDFHNIIIERPNGTIRTIGSLPMTINEGGISSYVVWQKVYELWNKGLLMVDNNPEGVTGIAILDASGHDVVHWWDNTGRYFNALMYPDLRERIIKNLEALNRQLDERLEN